MRSNDVLFDVLSVVTDEGTLRTLVSLSVRERVLGQVVLPDEGLLANVAPEVLLSVRCRVLRQRRLLGKTFITDGTCVGQLFRVGPMVYEQLRLAHHHLVALAARALFQVVLAMVLETLNVKKLAITNSATSSTSFRAYLRFRFGSFCFSLSLPFGDCRRSVLDDFEDHFGHLVPVLGELDLCNDLLHFIVKFSSQGYAVKLLMSDQSVSVHKVLLATLTLKWLLLAVLAMVNSKLGDCRKSLATVAAGDLRSKCFLVSLQLLGIGKDKFADAAMADKFFRI